MSGYDSTLSNLNDEPNECVEQWDLLASCQVNQVQLSRELHLCLHVLLLDVDEENTVAAGAVLIHV